MAKITDWLKNKAIKDKAFRVRYEKLTSCTLQGKLHYEEGWMIGDAYLETLLEALDNQEITVRVDCAAGVVLEE